MDKYTLAFVGDIALNGRYIDLYKKGENPFKRITPLLSDTDGVVGNLECMAKGVQGENLLKKPRLTTTVDTLNYLKTIKVKLVSLAHNHVYDHLEDGFNRTTDFLTQNKIQYLGASRKKENVGKPVILTKNGIRIGFLNYVTRDTNPNLPEEATVSPNFFTIEKVRNDIKVLKAGVDHVVLLLHWGGRVEGGLFPDWDQPALAHNLIDAGADLIIGHHSHTIQPYEVYKGKYIFYSLGNFCFSDIYHEGKLYSILSKRQKQSLFVKVIFRKQSYGIAAVFLKNEQGFLKRAKSTPIYFLFYKKGFPYITKSKFLWKLYYLKFKKINSVSNYLFVQKKSPLKALKVNKIKKYLDR